jgi:aminoglycoside N3'-acetyltransferase
MFCVHISEEQFVLPYTETRPRHSIFSLKTSLKDYNTGHGQREERNEETKKKKERKKTIKKTLFGQGPALLQ